jgi:signal transduction histidine kinase/ligand-binding sensor domain-containing protein
VSETCTSKARESNISRSLSLSLLLFFFAVNSALALDPKQHISQFGHTAWRMQDGGFRGTPHAITQTTDGYLWIGTDAGLVRFDGVRFVPWSAPAGKALPSSIIASLLGAGDDLWIGTQHGLSRWSNGDLVNYANDGRINAIVQDAGGAVWIANRSAANPRPLCQVINTELRCYGKEDGIPFARGLALIGDTHRNLWIGSDEGLCRWQPGSATAYLENELKKIVGLDGVNALASAQDGSLWAGIGPGRGLGLVQFTQGAWKSYVVPGLNGATLAVNALLVDRQNAVWIGTLGQGLYRVYDGKADHFASVDGLSGDSVEGFYEDREGNVWVATPKGIDRFHNLPVVSLSMREGLTADHADSVLATRDGSVWIGNQDALDLLRDNSLSAITAREGLPGHYITSLLEDHTGTLWVGVDDKLTVYGRGRFRSIGSPGGAVVAITEDTDRNVWASYKGRRIGLLRIRDLKIDQDIALPADGYALGMGADPKSGIWLALHNGGLARYRDGRFESVSSDLGVFAGLVESLLVDPDGTVWGATNQGVLAWRQGEIKTLSSRNGLPCDATQSLVRDNLNALWLSMDCGLVAIDESELQKWWKQPSTTLKVRTFDALDGMQQGGCDFQPCATRSLDGRLWFAGTFVLQMIDPDHLEKNVIPPPVHVEEVVADRTSYSPRDNLRLPPLTRDLEINYTALSFVVPQKVRFRYKLEGHDLNWQDPGTRRQAFYNDLGPGKYQFRVIASNNDGIWNDEGATLNFRIAPAWYQTISFRAACVGALVLLMWALYRLRLHQLERRFNLRLEERVGERTRIARDLHDTLLQSFHGLLLRFQTVSHVLPAGEAKQRLDDAIDQAAEAITEGRDAVQGLRSSTVESNDVAVAIRTLGEKLATSETGRSPAVFRVGVEGTPRTLHPILRDEVYRLAGEALRNAFQHAQARQIEVEIRYDEKQFRVRIRDDGKGIDPKVLGGEARVGHYGLQGMRERAKLVGGKLAVWSRIDSGTEVELSIPASTVYATPARYRSWLPGRGG